MNFAEPSFRRRFARHLGAIAIVALMPLGIAQAQAWPNKPMRVVVPFGPGSATDIVARTVGDELRVELGQPLLIDNRAGANGFIAAEAVARAAPDGYVLLASTNTIHSTNQFLFKKLPYDPVKDFIPVGGMHRGYYLLIVSGTMPVNSATELKTWIKANADKASYGWGATASQIAGFSFLKEANLSATGVPYKSSPQAVTDLIGGQISFMIQDVTSGLAHLKSGKVKALAVSAPVRLPQLPEVPSNIEAGLPTFDTTAWTGLFLPAGTPAVIVARLSAALQVVLRKPAVVQRLEACCSARMFPNTPAEFDEFLKQERIGWAQKIKAAGIQPE